MGQNLVPRYVASLNLSTLDDADMHTLVSDIKQVAPTCPLILASPPMQASVTALGTKDTALAKANVAVATDKQTLKTDIATEAVTRADLQGELRTYSALLASLAKSPADVHAAGLTPQPPRPPKNQPPAVPTSIINKPPKTGHGTTKVVVEETGPTRHQFTAQQSLDGTTWSALGAGFGRTRSVTGPSGTKVWVRFAMVRGQLQSDWSTPVLVTIP
jgi:hypothetical protein